MNKYNSPGIDSYEHIPEKITLSVVGGIILMVTFISILQSVQETYTYKCEAQPHPIYITHEKLWFYERNVENRMTLVQYERECK